MKKALLLLIAGGFLLFMVFGMNTGQEAPPHPILDTAAAEKVEQPLAPAADVTISEISYSQFETYAENGEVIGMVITTRENGPSVVTARLKSGAIVRATMAGESVMTDELRDSIGETEVPYDVNYQAEGGSSFMSFLIPMIIIFAAIMFLPAIIQRMRGGGGMGGAAPGTNGAPGKTVETPKVRLADVGGVKHIKPQLDDMIEKVLDTGTKGRLGGEVPKGFLFLGPPGTGKTLLARAIAGEVNARRTDGKQVGFLTASGSDFIEMYVGVGAKRVRELFAKARKHAPCIVFIDEIDALGKRDGGAAHGGGGNDERVQTLNALLTELDGFEGDSGVIVIAATNREDMIDDALKRPGRFDRKVSVPLPDMTGREEILNIHAKNLQKRAMTARVRQQRAAVAKAEGENGTQVAPQGVMAKRIAGRGARKGKVQLPVIFAKDVDFKSIARETPACSGADLAEILKRAAEIAENRNADVIEMADIRNAFQSLRLGDEMPREQEFVDEFTTAVHEILGHAVVAGQSRKTLGRDHADDVQSLTIVPRGMSLGAVWTSPTKDRVSHSQKYLLGRLRIAMAGQIAEKLYLGPDAVTSGASSDIQAATNIAAGMVSQYAMSNSEELTFRNYMEQGGFGVTKANAEKVDEEIDKLLREQYIRAEAIMLSFATAKDADGNDLMEMLTRAMLVKKTLQGEEFMRLISGEVVFDRAELDLGAQEAEFQTLWKAQLKHRQDRIAFLKKDHTAIANDYKL